MRDCLPIFPLEISPHVSTASTTEKQLLNFKASDPELALLSSRACEIRKTQFLLGRMAAHMALSQLGVTEPNPILKGPRGQPLWPDGYIGSITHTKSIGLAAVAKQENILALGIDLEARDRKFNHKTAKHVCTPAEEAWVFANGDDVQSRLLSLFSAKESIYKAYVPIIHGSLGFKDVDLTWDPTRNRFIGNLLRQVSFRDEVSAISSFTVQCVSQQGYICTWFVIQRQSPI